MAGGDRDRGGARALRVPRGAACIDEKRFDEWYELFTDDARYWMPLTRGQPDGETLHVAVLRGQAAPQGPDRASQESAAVLAAVSRAAASTSCSDPAVERDGGREGPWLRTPFMYCEIAARYAARAGGRALTTVSSLEAGGLRMRLKKVELINCDAACRPSSCFPVTTGVACGTCRRHGIRASSPHAGRWPDTSWLQCAAADRRALGDRGAHVYAYAEAAAGGSAPARMHTRGRTVARAARRAAAAEPSGVPAFTGLR